MKGARETLLAILSDGDDAGALSQLVDDAIERGDTQEAVDFLRRLGALATTPEEKINIALREAGMLAEQLDDTEGALARYEAIVKDLDPRNRIALHAIADLHEKRNDQPGVAAALEREIPLTEGDEKVELAQRLAQLYEGALDDPRGAIRALDVVHAADPEDFDAIARLQKLSEQVEDWPRVATLMAALIEVEGDEEEASRLTVRLAEILADKLEPRRRVALRPGEARRSGRPVLPRRLRRPRRPARAGRASSPPSWWPGTSPAPALPATRRCARRSTASWRSAAMRTRPGSPWRSRAPAAPTAPWPRSSRSWPRGSAISTLSASRTTCSVKDLSGSARAAELVRQAEVQVAAGIDPLEAMQHGESGLASVPAAEVEPLLGAARGAHPGARARHRSLRAPGGPLPRPGRSPRPRSRARRRSPPSAAPTIAPAASSSWPSAAASRKTPSARSKAAARLGDDRAGGIGLRTTLAEALAAGGQGSRDGGRTRGALLRRAATIAHRDLGDIDKAFGWLGDALITHVEDASLEALEALGRELNALPRVEATLTRALEEVFDGPLVRKLLQRRARLRRDVLDDKKGAAVDLKKLHDLSPSDLDVMNELSALLLELGDHRGMIQLYEDQNPPRPRPGPARRAGPQGRPHLGGRARATPASPPTPGGACSA